jgi:effector-binding domain-containing protein
MVTEVDARPTLVVKATTSRQQFPLVWKELLDEVWACVRAAGIHSGCRNVMLYRGGVSDVEVGVETSAPIAQAGRVVTSTLPAGRVAMTVHRGSYAGLKSAHQAVLEWCRQNGERVTGTRWEVYGPHNDDIEQIWTEISWLLD